MNLTKFSLFILIFSGSIGFANAQFFDYTNLEKPDYHNTELTNIFFAGKSVVQPDSPDGPLWLGPKMAGKFTVMKVDPAGAPIRSDKPIGFKVAIKIFRTNTVWLFSEKTFYELDLKEVIDKCGPGDQMIFMLEDTSYRLPRHVVVVGDGC